MLVRDVMKRYVATIRPDDPLSLAVQEMLWAGTRHLPVLRDGRLVGMITERDILRYRASGVSDKPLQNIVEEAMTAPAQFADPDDTLTVVADRMVSDQIGSLPVLQRGDLVGIVTTTDLLANQVRQAFENGEGQHPLASDLMTTNPVTSSASDSLLDAAAKMSQANVRHLPVVDGDGRIIGMLSDRDIRLPASEMRGFDAESSHESLARVRVSAVMTSDVVSLQPGAPFSLLVSAFSDWRLSAVPVVDRDDKLLGIISYVDVVRARGERPA